MRLTALRTGCMTTCKAREVYWDSLVWHVMASQSSRKLFELDSCLGCLFLLFCNPSSFNFGEKCESRIHCKFSLIYLPRHESTSAFISTEIKTENDN